MRKQRKAICKQQSWVSDTKLGASSLFHLSPEHKGRVVMDPPTSANTGGWRPPPRLTLPSPEPRI